MTATIVILWIMASLSFVGGILILLAKKYKSDGPIFLLVLLCLVTFIATVSLFKLSKGIKQDLDESFEVVRTDWVAHRAVVAVNGIEYQCKVVRDSNDDWVIPSVKVCKPVGTVKNNDVEGVGPGDF